MKNKVIFIIIIAILGLGTTGYFFWKSLDSKDRYKLQQRENEEVDERLQQIRKNIAKLKSIGTYNDESRVTGTSISYTNLELEAAIQQNANADETIAALKKEQVQLADKLQSLENQINDNSTQINNARNNQ